MSKAAHNKAITDLLPDTLIELYEVDAGPGMGIKMFHAGKIIDKNIVFNGFTYTCIPIEADGFESKGDGTLARPRLVVGNPDGIISDMIKRQDDMVGNKFKRIRVFLKFLDAANFPENDNPFGTPDPDARFDDDIYIFNRKVSENKYYIEFELISPLEVENYKLPARLMIANYCPWRYRGIGCRYGQKYDDKGPETALKQQDDWGKKIFSPEFFSPDIDVGGVPMADENDKRFDDPNNGYGLSYLTWAGEYGSEDFSTVTVSATVSTASNPTTVNVITGGVTSATKGIQREIRIGRTVPLKDSAGSSIGSMEVTETAKKTVNVTAASALSDIAASGVVLDLRFITGGEGYVADSSGTLAGTGGGGTSFAGTFTTDSDGAVDSSSINAAAITNGGSGYTEPPTVTLAGTATGSETIPAVIEATLLQTLTVKTPLPAQLEIGEVITFGAGKTFDVGEVAPVGARDIRGTNTSTAIAEDDEGALRTTIVGNVLLDTGSSLAINSTGVVGYSKGNVVVIKPGSGSLIDKDEVKTTDPASDEPPAYFVCIKGHTTNQDPRFKKEYWVEDQCSKTLNGCRMRFGQSAKLPFGGFPSIESYRYTN
jgi:lambda family phage minor tail protein L